MTLGLQAMLSTQRAHSEAPSDLHKVPQGLAASMGDPYFKIEETRI